MKNISVILFYLGITLSSIAESTNKANNAMFCLDGEVRTLLISKTGGDSISRINSVAYKSIEGFEVFGIDVELIRKPGLKGEGNLHVRLAFIRNTTTAVIKVYSCDRPLYFILQEQDLKQMLSKMEPYDW